MKKIFKNKIIQNGLFFILGAVIFGGIGVVATTYVLQSSEIQYKDNKSVQQAIEELYVLSQNSSGSTQTLPIGTIVSEGYKITIPYTGSYQQAKCVYGTTENYGSEGTISNNKCIFMGINPNQKLYYKIVTTNITDSAEVTIYENSGSVITGASGVTIVKDSLPTGVKAIVYLDPTNLGNSCNESNSSVGGTAKSGCMKWYAFKEDSSSYTMILDHNTTATVAWNSSGSTTSMNEVQIELNNLVSSTEWKFTPRLITGQEIADIIEHWSWKSTIPSGWFYLDSKNHTQTATSEGASKYYWLYDYTDVCTKFGCNVADGSNIGYWTSTPVSANEAWSVNKFGKMDYYSVDYASHCGVRPVITISKSSL